MATPVDLAGAQHLAHLRQEDSVPQAVSVHQRQQQQAVSELRVDLEQLHLEHQQVALAEAGLEAHLQQQQRQERK